MKNKRGRPPHDPDGLWSGGALAEYRRRGAYTQAQLAALIGVCKATISAWERGEAAPTQARATQLAGILKTRTRRFYHI